eukprot:gb/GECG01009451.1/.p1 GENE.gb/GECG01009451.1/~~gb/GECG01009451.1/.p1  ORF type:complete len:225 (+),score=25.75 gb/GECG01009451.1/:1-675(+)
MSLKQEVKRGHQASFRGLSGFIMSFLMLLAVQGHSAYGQQQQRRSQHQSLDTDSLQRPFLLAHKDIETGNDEGVIIKGRNFTVRYSIYNAGNVPALEVTLNDQWPQENFHVVSGEYEGEWKEIGPGERVETSVVLIAKVDGVFSAGRAQIAYMYTDQNDNLEERDLSSSTFGRIQIVTENSFKRITNDFFIDWIYFAGLASIPTLIPFMVWNSYRKNAKYATGK